MTEIADIEKFTITSLFGGQRTLLLFSSLYCVLHSVIFFLLPLDVSGLVQFLFQNIGDICLHGENCSFAPSKTGPFKFSIS